MNKKMVPILIAAVVVAGAGGFFAGLKYGQSKSSQLPLGNMRNLTAEQRQQMAQQNGGRNFQGMQPNGTGERNGGFLNGEIIFKDDKSATVKLRAGGSQIIFFSEATAFTKSATSTAGDLKVGDTVMVNGSANADGSVNAESIQLMPNLPNPLNNN